MGCVSPLGLTVAETWEGLVNARSGVSLVEEFSTAGFPARMAAQVRGFDPQRYLGWKELRRVARFTQLAAGAVCEALEQAELDLAQLDRTRVGVQIGSAIGALAVIEEQSRILREQGVRRVNPVFVPTVIVSAAPCHIAVHYGIQGPTSAPAAACATGIVAIGDGMRLLQRGEADVVLAGGSESTITPLALASFSRLGALSTRNDDPARACRPFDASRDGTVVGEGAAVLVLEAAEHARRRGARILAEVVGYGLAEDGYHMTAPEPNGDGAARAMGLALQDAGLDPSGIDCIIAHGTGTPLNDVSETRAIHTVFGDWAGRIPISSHKGATGHTLGAAGALSTVVGVQAILERLVPPTVNLETPDPECDLDYVPGRARGVDLHAVLVNAIGFGGQNACLIVRRWAQGG